MISGHGEIMNSSPGKMMKILLADDEPIARTMLEHWINGWGYEPICVRDGREALTALEQDPEIRMAVLDWVMPEMDGIDICQKLREQAREPYVYVILLTARDDKKDLVRGLDSGADDYLVKPCNPIELRVRLRAGRRVVELQQQLIDAREELRIKAMRDPLTGVLNRGAIMDYARRELSRGERTRQPLSVVMVDLDRFKGINDRHGHAVGDAVLVTASERLGTAIRNYDSLGRLGGEEFLMVLPECDLEASHVVAERVRALLAGTPVVSENVELPVTASFGVASTIQCPTARLEQLVRAADLAMYRAKCAGRNRVVVAEQADWRAVTSPTPSSVPAA